MSTVFMSNLLEKMNISYPVYGYHAQKGSISFLNQISFINFLIRNCDYKYLGGVFGSIHSNLVNRYYGYDWNTDEYKTKTEYFWIFTDRNDNRVNVISVIETYINHIYYGPKFRNVEKPGMPVPYTSSKRKRRKKYREQSFNKSTLIEQEIRNELKEEYGYIKNMKTKKNVAVSMKKWVRKQRDTQTKSWKLYRNTQWDK